MGITKHITPHKFRHAVSSELKHSGPYTDEEIIQITGHKDTDSLKYYAHPRSEAVVKMRQELSLGVMPKARNNE
jgi:integrase